jgi:hypothetical protein
MEFELVPQTSDFVLPLKLLSGCLKPFFCALSLQIASPGTMRLRLAWRQT